jgi:HAD superfamily hydrolase (TIGR01509 family)
MLALLHDLKPRYRLALLSNAWQVEMEQWLEENHKLGSMFEVVVSSAAVRMAKPDQPIYELTLERLGLTPGEALFIDDLARNTVVAEAMGLPCVVFESPAQLRHALTVRGLL